MCLFVCKLLYIINILQRLAKCNHFYIDLEIIFVYTVKYYEYYKGNNNMKDPKVIELVQELKENIKQINSIHQKLDAHNVWVNLQRKEKGTGWELRNLEQRVKY